MALLAIVLARADLASLADMLISAHPIWLALAVVMTILALSLDASKLSLLLGEKSPGAGKIIHLNFMASFWNNFLPGASVGGDIFRIRRLAGPAGSALSAGAGVLTDRMTNLWIHALILIAAFPFFQGSGLVPSDRALFAGTTAAILLVLPAMCFRSVMGLLGRVFGLLPVSLGGGFDARDAFNPYVRRLSPASPALPFILALGLALKTADMVAIMCLSRALGGEADLFQAAAAGMLGTLVGFLPISVGGWGLSEGAFFLAFQVLQRSGERGVGISLGLRLCLLVPSVLGFVFYLREKRRPKLSGA